MSFKPRLSSAPLPRETGEGTGGRPSEQPPVHRASPTDRVRLAVDEAGAEAGELVAGPDLCEGALVRVAEGDAIRTHHHATGHHLALVRDVRALPGPVARHGHAVDARRLAVLLDVRQAQLDTLARRNAAGALEDGLD